MNTTSCGLGVGGSRGEVVETCYKTTAACLLGNASYRSKLRLDWDDEKETVAQKEARPYLTREYRKPWRLVL